jgi:ATP-binding cassette subfamily F protein uup
MFLFSPEQLKQPVRALSGGELARIHIARLMLIPADVLILDEPTNDLDLASLEVLEESLEEFPGAIVLVTHDRAMLARLATRVLALDGEGGARYFTDFDQWETFVEQARKGSSRTSEPAAAKPSFPDRTPAASAAPAAPAEPKKKLAYKEQRELEGMEKSIQVAEADVVRLEALTNNAAHMADRTKADAAWRDLAKAQAEVARLYARWAELESRV